MGQNDRPVVALAGRRIDAADAVEAHFPLAIVEIVRQQVEDAFASLKPRYLVCSAACGSDLLALQIAQSDGIPFHIILPFGVAKFKETSVLDRPGSWGDIYDQVVAEAAKRSRLTLLEGVGEGDGAYSKTTEAIIAKASTLSQGGRTIAVTVTDRGPRVGHDATAELSVFASKAGFETLAIEIPRG